VEDIIIELNQVYKSFGSKDVLKGINLSIAKGQTLVVIGRSGIGKSVMLKHIIGLMEPDSGSVKVFGRDLSSLSHREMNELMLSMGMVFQGGALFDSLTVSENVGFVLREYYGLSNAEIDKRIAESLDLVGLDNGVWDLLPSSISGGMAKRVAIARAICHRPKVLLYDEPTTGLDPITADIIDRLIMRMHDELGVTSVVVSHDMTSAFKIASRIVMLHNGNFVIDAEPEEVKNSQNPVVRQFITGSAYGPMTGAGRIKGG